MSNIEVRYLVYFKKTEQSETTLRHSAVRYSIFCGSLFSPSCRLYPPACRPYGLEAEQEANHVKFHTSTASGRKPSSFKRCISATVP